MNNLAPMENCPGGVQGNLNWMPGYMAICFHLLQVLAQSETYNIICFDKGI